MCTSQKSFKLCTCNDLEIETADWVLRRLNSNGKNSEFILGESNAKFHLEDSEKEIQNKILTGLNGADVFDFEYLPNHGDLIQFITHFGFLYYEFIGVRWEISTKDNLSGGYKYLWKGRIDLELNDIEYFKPTKKLRSKSNFTQRMQIGKGTTVIKKGNGKPHNIKI